ncbi:hypothetical protein BV898_02089 [Hypsibius exemplaris]|uniref:Protein quiver n=1 Tax=Hypsibius exemplaris TaxID=2072580 RepID=A0A1W0X9Q7_HYPEX|nr:hypothetical protein BV898_02089 [Hypsibius exemplaris]
MNKIIFLLFWCLIDVHVEATLQCYRCSSKKSHPEYSEHCPTDLQTISGPKLAPSVTCSGSCSLATISIKAPSEPDKRFVFNRNCSDEILPDGLCSYWPNKMTMSDATIDSIVTQCFCNTEFCNGGRNDPQITCKSTPAPTISAAHLTTSSVASNS